MFHIALTGMERDKTVSEILKYMHMCIIMYGFSVKS